MKAATLVVAALLCFALCAFAAAGAVPLADNHVDVPVLLDATNTTAIVSLTNDIPDSSFTILYDDALIHVLATHHAGVSLSLS